MAASATSFFVRFLAEAVDGEDHYDDHNGTDHNSSAYDDFDFDHHDDHDEDGYDYDAVLSSSSKPWGNVLLASFIIMSVTFVGALLAALTSNRCFRRVLRPYQYSALHKIVIPGFAAGALLATAVFLIVPESLSLLAQGNGNGVVVHDDHRLLGAEEGEEDGEHDEFDHLLYGGSNGTTTSSTTEIDHDHEGEDESSFVWKFGAAFLAGFLLPVLLAAMFPPPAECPECVREEEEEELPNEVVASSSDDDLLLLASNDGEEDGVVVAAPLPLPAETTFVGDDDDEDDEEQGGKKVAASGRPTEEDDSAATLATAPTTAAGHNAEGQAVPTTTPKGHSHPHNPRCHHHHPHHRNDHADADSSATVPAVDIDDTIMDVNASDSGDRGATTASKKKTKKEPPSGDGSVCSQPERTVLNLPLALSILLGDALHNFVDGLFVGAAFLSCSNVAFALMATTIYHELAQELADFVLLTHHCGLPVWKALLANFLSGLSVLIGACVVLAADLTPEATGVILALSGGVYMYITAVETVPKIMAHTRSSPRGVLLFAVCFVTGAVPIGLVLLNHGHCEAGGEGGHDEH